MAENESLLLKWGTLKGWNLKSEKSLEIMRRYVETGVSYGAAMRRDTPEQKEIICELIDAIEGEIQNDWSGEMMTKNEAKRYVREYPCPPARSPAGSAQTPRSAA